MAQRRLAAIMFTDIVGYDSLLKEDEKKAFDTRKKNQRIHKRLIKRFKGQWLKEMGGGILASFHSNIDAVMCALSIQKATKEVEIPLRIGIHQGDVIFEKKDVLGDGVNIASRIQNVINTNGIIISEKVYSDIKNKEELEIESLGIQTLKGIDTPVGIYKVTCQNESFLDFTIDTGELVRPLSFSRSTIIVGIIVIALLAYALYYFLPQIINPSSEQEQSLLVLPFNNYLGTDTLDYFVAGMHDALIGDIGKIGAMQVKSKTTANAYKNTNKSIPEIAEELGVNTFIEGAVLCLGDSVCLRVKLYSADQAEKELWVEDFYVERSQILNLYHEVTKRISKEINVILSPEEERLLAESRAVDNEAYDAYLKGMYYWEQLTPEAFEKSLEYFNLAMEKDPTWANSYAASALWWVGVKQIGAFPASVANPKIYEYIEKALELNPNSDYIHFVNAGIAVWTEWDWEKGEQEFLRAAEINPNNALNRGYYSHLLIALGRTDEAYEQCKLALEGDPLNPLVKALYTWVLFEMGKYEEARSIASEVPEQPAAIFVEEAIYYQEGDYHNSFKKIIEYISMYYFDGEIISQIEKTYENKGYSEALEQVYNVFIEQAKTSHILSGDIAAFCRKEMNKPERALDMLEKGFESNDGIMPYISLNMPCFNYLQDEPRFIALLKKMNLPVD